MSDTTTTNYGFVKPEVTGSPDTWGTKWNTNADTIDTKIKMATDLAAAALPKAGGTMTGDTLFELVKCGTAAKPASQIHGSALSIHAAGGAQLAGVDTAGNGTFLDVTITSDRRMKTDIEEVPPKALLAAILQIPPVEFNWIEHPDERQLGVIAQDVDKVLANAVRFIDGRLHVRQVGLVAALIGAVQALTERVVALESK